MESKLLAYRSKKKREAMVESAKNTLKRVISWESDTTENPQIIPVDTEDSESMLSEESIDLTSKRSPLIVKVTYLLCFLLWATLYVISLHMQFGAVYFVVSSLVLIWLNTRTGPKKSGEISAYSVFNPNCESIDGTFKAEDIDRHIRSGGLIIH